MKKRVLSLLAVVAGVALMCGCGDDANGSESSTQSGGAVSGNEAGVAQYNAEDYVTLGEYKGIEISVPEKIEYNDTDFELETRMLYFDYVTETEGIKDRPVELYDMTNIDYEGKKDGVAFDGGTAQGATLLIGSGQFIDGFEDGLIGVMPGETVDLNLKFPENYHSADLAGQEVVFTVTVNYIPEMKDEKVSQIGIQDVNTVEGLRQYVEEAMTSSAESEYIANAGAAAIAQVVETAQFSELPEVVLEENKQAYRDYLDQLGSQFGVDGKTYVSMTGSTVDYETIVTDNATLYTKEILAVQVIADKEGLNLTPEAFDARMEEYASLVGVTKDDLLVNGITEDDYRESFLYEDVLTFLAENAVNTVSE